MTYHSSLGYELGDPCTDEVVAEIVKGLRTNKEYNKGKRFQPDAYSTLSVIDSFIENIGQFLDRDPEQKTVHGFLIDAQHIVQRPGVEIIQRVLKEMAVEMISAH